MSSAAPLVTIGIPTYNRAEGVAGAVDSARRQTYERIEIVISDNASSDGTEAVCREMAAQDERVRYVRQAVNLGATENFNQVLRHATGTYVTLLADDDWLDHDYVERCVEVLERHPDHAVVAGVAEYHGDAAAPIATARLRLLEESAAERVVAYYRTVADNAAYYGVLRRDAVERAPAIPNVLAGDWMFVANLAYLGKLETIDSTRVHRSAGGTSTQVERIVRGLGLPRVQSRVPYLAMAWNALADIAWGSPVYAAEGVLGRWLLGVRAAWAVARGRPHLWQLLYPVVPWSRRRPRARWISTSYERVAALLGRR